MPDLVGFQETLGVVFSDLSLLELALVHSSYVNENQDLASGSNERLEFLGDAVLGLVIAERLYKGLPDLTEGEMTRFRSAVVRRDTLARVAQKIGLGDYLYLGKGEEASGGRHKTANLAGAIEAVIAAVFLDQGLGGAGNLVLRLLDEELLRVIRRGREVDYKSQLQEIVQSRHKTGPAYRLVTAVGPDHDKCFTVEVMVGDVVMGRGEGKSKKSAETEAARLALERLSADFTG